MASIKEIEKKLAKQFEKIDDVAFFNQKKVLDAFMSLVGLNFLAMLVILGGNAMEMFSLKHIANKRTHLISLA